jgi:hypothetical protein
VMMVMRMIPMIVLRLGVLDERTILALALGVRHGDLRGIGLDPSYGSRLRNGLEVDADTSTYGKVQLEAIDRTKRRSKKSLALPRWDGTASAPNDGEPACADVRRSAPGLPAQVSRRITFSR